MELPTPIKAYFDANARLDAAGMLSPFAQDAVVRDEARIHQGKEAIRQWIEQASLSVSAIATPEKIRSEDDRHTIEARAAGNFAGSPLSLSFDFRLENGRIRALEIR